MFEKIKNKLGLPSLVALILGTLSLALIIGYSNCSAPTSGGGTSQAATSALPTPYSTGGLSISPVYVTLTLGGIQTFTAAGGSGIYTFNVISGGGTINQTTGMYTAPETSGVTTVEVLDTNSNVATANITIGSGTGGGGIGGTTYYSCPVTPSQNCVNTSVCQSTCVGQYTNNSTCTWYSENAVPNTVSCAATASIPSAYSCPTTLSYNCESASACESSCVGQFQSGSTCTTHGYGGAPTSQTCTLETDGSLAVYLCPLTMSNSCDNMTACESSCMGQYQSGSTCTYYNHNAVPTTLQCTYVSTSF